MESPEENRDVFEPNTSLIGKKTPYALLQEILSHNKILPKPDFDVIGPDNSQLFRCKITFLFLENGSLSFSVTGPAGTGKKPSQHSAAVAALNYIGLSPAWIEAADQSGEHMKWKVDFDKFERLVGSDFTAPDSNPGEAAGAGGGQQAAAPAATEKWVLMLREFAVDNGYELPEFEVTDQRGPSHQPTFRMVCSVKEEDSETTVSTAMIAMTNTKQLRRMISQKLLMELHELKEIAWDGPPLPPGEIFKLPEAKPAATDDDQRISELQDSLAQTTLNN